MGLLVSQAHSPSSCRWRHPQSSPSFSSSSPHPEPLLSLLVSVLSKTVVLLSCFSALGFSCFTEFLLCLPQSHSSWKTLQRSWICGASGRSRGWCSEWARKRLFKGVAGHGLESHLQNCKRTMKEPWLPGRAPGRSHGLQSRKLIMALPACGRDGARGTQSPTPSSRCPSPTAPLWPIPACRWRKDVLHAAIRVASWVEGLWAGKGGQPSALAWESPS